MQLAAIANVINQMKKPGDNMHSLTKDAKAIVLVSKVMAMGVWYKSLLDRQKIVVSRLYQHVSGNRKYENLDVLADQEDAIRNDFETLAKQLEQHARKLPAGYNSLSKSALEFVKTLHKLGITTPLKACVTSLKNKKSREALNYAQNALEKMEQVLDKCKQNQFANTCSGNLTFRVPSHLSRTMSEMLESLTKQFADGVGWGDDAGAAGVGISGAWEGSYLNGYAAFNLPVYGPERKNPFTSAALSQGVNGNGPGLFSGHNQKDQYQEAIHDRQIQKPGATGFFMEMVPVRYREAVKTFYSTDDLKKDDKKKE